MLLPRISPLFRRRYVSARVTHFSSRSTPRVVKLARRARLRETMQRGSGVLRIVVDCSLDDAYRMSEKELRKLASQIRYIYSLTASHSQPPSYLTLTGLEVNGRVELALKEHILGYKHMLMKRTTQAHYEYFEPKSLVYLSPDSTEVLQEVRNDKVYVLGGVVDSTITKGLTEKLARNQQLATARLPVAETLRVSRNVTVGHLNLPINIGILLSVYAGCSWAEAFIKFLPKRKGYISTNSGS